MVGEGGIKQPGIVVICLLFQHLGGRGRKSQEVQTCLGFMRLPQNIKIGAGKITLLVRHLPCTHKESLDAQHSSKRLHKMAQVPVAPRLGKYIKVEL